MATLQSTESFSNGDVLSASALTSHVTAATPLPDFIAGQDPLNDPAGVDQLLINDIDGGAVKRITVSTLAQHLPATIVSSLTVSGSATVSNNLSVTGEATVSGISVTTDATVGGLFTASGQSLLGDDVTLGASSSNDITLVGSLAGTIQGTPVVDLTDVTDAYGDKVLIQDASDSDKLKTVAACLPKAWACISTKTADTTTVAATVSRTAGSPTATVTKAGHGFKVGDVIYLDNGVADGWYDIKTVPDVDTFTVQTVATTVLSSAATQWYALTVNGFGISSAFKESASSNIVNVNFAVPFTSANYAPQLSFFNQQTALPAGIGIIEGSVTINSVSFDKTVNNFSIKITYGYTTTALNDGQVLISVFGNI